MHLFSKYFSEIEAVFETETAFTKHLHFDKNVSSPPIEALHSTLQFDYNSMQKKK